MTDDDGFQSVCATWDPKVCGCIADLGVFTDLASIRAKWPFKVYFFILKHATIADIPELMECFVGGQRDRWGIVDPHEEKVFSFRTIQYRCRSGHTPRLQSMRFLDFALGRETECCSIGASYTTMEERGITRTAPKFSGSSQVELMHFEAAVEVFGDAESGKDVIEAGMSRPWTVDIYTELLDEKIAIEYDGRRWHSGDDKVAVDIRKTTDLLAAGFMVVRLREHGLESLGIEHPRYREFMVISGTPRAMGVIREVRRWILLQLAREAT